MKLYMKRFTSGLMALLLVLSLFVGGLPAKVFAATGSYTYNTGTRHDYNAVLSDQAKAYYTGDYTWEKLSALEGGTEDCLDQSSAMFQALNELMTDTMTKSVSYSSLPDYWEYTDASDGSSGTIWFYWDTTSSGTMSREHVWPKSHASFHENDGGCDLHHLRPSISNINSSRGNLIMGNVQGLSGASAYSYGGNVVLYKTSKLCEVNDNIKGDVARIFLYVWCRWEEPNLFKDTPNPIISANDSANDGGKVIESLDTLLEWCAIDPVDTWEMSRNDQTEKIQGNRNVFIDYPEFAWLIFGQDVPADLNTPSDNGGTTVNPGCTHSWNAATCTSPKTCSKCGATEGSAAGHSWQAATCLQAMTCLTCGATEGSVASHADANGDKICDTCGTSMGTVTPPAVSGSGYILITSADQLTTGQYVMIADHGYAPGVYDNGWLTAVQPTVSDNVVTDAQGGVWTLTFDGTSVTLTDSNGVTVKPKSGNNNGIISGSYDWAWEFDESAGTTKFKGVGSDTTTLASNKTSGNMFRAYKNSTASGYPCNFKLYKLVEHTHSYVGTVTTEPTCTASGVKTYTCSGCSDSYTEEIAALGHSYDAVVTAPTCTTAGYTTYTCSVCDHSYTADNVDALGHTYVDGKCSVCGEADPDAPTGPIADTNLKFRGDAGISFQDYIGMNIMFQNSVADAYDEFYVVATQVAPDGTITESVCNAVPVNKSYTIFEHPVMAWSMTEQVTLTLYAKKGDVLYVGESRTASVESLALTKLAAFVQAGTTENCAMLVDMLNYGAELQKNQKHFADSIPSAGEYAIYATVGTPDLTATTIKEGTGKGFLNGPGLSMQAKVEFNFMVKVAELTGRTVKVFCDGVELEDAVVFQDYNQTYKYVRIAIKATQMRSTFTVALYDNATGEAYTQVITTSVEALGLQNITAGKNVDLVNALIRYGDSVYAYANKGK